MTDDLQNQKLCMEAYRSGFNEGQKHLVPSPETTRIIAEMKAEWSDMQKAWKQINNRALIALLGSLVVAGGYGIWVGTIQTRLDNGEATHDSLTASVVSIEARQHANDISSTEIRTKLANIELTLVEIKNALKK